VDVTSLSTFAALRDPEVRRFISVANNHSSVLDELRISVTFLRLVRSLDAEKLMDGLPPLLPALDVASLGLDSLLTFGSQSAL
jgi:hypothetical protein